jgi:hypothetical protein
MKDLTEEIIVRERNRLASVICAQALEIEDLKREIRRLRQAMPTDSTCAACTHNADFGHVCKKTF